MVADPRSIHLPVERLRLLQPDLDDVDRGDSGLGAGQQDHRRGDGSPLRISGRHSEQRANRSRHGRFADDETPLIAGTPVVGVTLSATPGTWGPAPGITYQWKSSGTAISGATGSTFTPTATQLGHPITVTVTGTQSGYTTASTTSLATSNVGLGTLSATTPTIAGSPVVGGTLTAVPGKWRPYPVVMSYQWYVGGAAFPGATAQTFVIPGSAAGQAISVAATGSETGYTPTTLTSAATAAVTGGALSGPTPTITGNPQVGATLTGESGHLGAGACRPRLPVGRGWDEHHGRDVLDSDRSCERPGQDHHGDGHRLEVRIRDPDEDERRHGGGHRRRLDDRDADDLRKSFGGQQSHCRPR